MQEKPFSLNIKNDRNFSIFQNFPNMNILKMQLTMLYVYMSSYKIFISFVNARKTLLVKY
jgi:hypothetical protein